MAKFTDKLNREWELEITVGHMKPLRELGFDLNQAAKDARTALKSLDDYEKLVGVLWTLVEPTATARNITPEDFGKGLDGPSLAAGFDAFLGAFADFSLRPTVAAEVKKRLPDRIKKVEQEAVKEIERQDQDGSKNTPGESPGSSASTPQG